MLRNHEYEKHSCGMIFYPALTPLEAAVMPAESRRFSGALSHLRRETARRFCREAPECAQRTKIWVR